MSTMEGLTTLMLLCNPGHKPLGEIDVVSRETETARR
jgi:hypothetical protein